MKKILLILTLFSSTITFAQEKSNKTPKANRNSQRSEGLKQRQHFSAKSHRSEVRNNGTSYRHKTTYYRFRKEGNGFSIVGSYFKRHKENNGYNVTKPTYSGKNKKKGLY